MKLMPQQPAAARPDRKELMMSDSTTAPSLIPTEAPKIFSLPGRYNLTTPANSDVANHVFLTPACWDQLEPLLTEIENDPTHPNKIVRAEFVWSDHQLRRGALLFTNKPGRPFIYVRDAFVGYDGSGTILGKRVLRAIGVTDALIRDADELVGRYDYTLVFSRESTSVGPAQPTPWTVWKAAS